MIKETRQSLADALGEYHRELAAEIGNQCALDGSTPGDYDSWRECCTGLGRSRAYAIARAAFTLEKGKDNE